MCSDERFIWVESSSRTMRPNKAAIRWVGLRSTCFCVRIAQKSPDLILCKDLKIAVRMLII